MPSTITVKVELIQNALTVNTQQVQPDAYPMDIAWQLTNMPTGATWPTDDPNHLPFKWLDNNNKPSPGTFGEPGISGDDLTAQDNGPAGGPWPYQLCVKIDTQYYYTPDTSGPKAGGGGAPTIKNC